jgi:hypothetical protein
MSWALYTFLPVLWLKTGLHLAVYAISHSRLIFAYIFGCGGGVVRQDGGEGGGNLP